MHFLVTNDDGVFAEGLTALVRELRKIAKVTVVAPDRERSAVGHALTFFDPIRVQKIREEKRVKVYSCDGTPSDCVLLGIYSLMDERPDLVVSGINKGGNLGDDITYSGTVSAAMEGIIHGVPSFAVSVASFQDVRFDVAARWARIIAGKIMREGLPPRTFLNVNVPNLPAEEIKGFSITRQGRSIYEQRVLKRFDPRGTEYYWLTGELPTGEPEDGTDFEAVFRGFVSITPVHLCLTDFSQMERLKKWNLTL
ncbi:MAG: 5'/3'-nucleotidase SurE [bacterium]